MGDVLMPMSAPAFEYAREGVGTVTSKSFKVLIVDDEENTRKFLQAALVSEGYDCRLAENIEEAETLLREMPFHLALVDLYLGTANGLNVLDLVKVIQPQCKCVMMTGLATVETVARSIASGA